MSGKAKKTKSIVKDVDEEEPVEVKKKFDSVRDAIDGANNTIKLLLLYVSSLDLDELEEMSNALSTAVGGAPIFMAQGATMKWLNTVMAKEKTIKKVIELKKEMDKIIKEGNI